MIDEHKIVFLYTLYDINPDKCLQVLAQGVVFYHFEQTRLERKEIRLNKRIWKGKKEKFSLSCYIPSQLALLERTNQVMGQRGLSTTS